MARSLQQDSKPGQILCQSNTRQQTLRDPACEPQDSKTSCKTIARQSRSAIRSTLLHPFNRTQDSKPGKIPSAGQQTWPNLFKPNTGQQTLTDPSNEPQDNTTVCKTIARRSRSDSNHLLTWLDPFNRTQDSKPADLDRIVATY